MSPRGAAIYIFFQSSEKKTHQVQTRVKENSLLIKVTLGGALVTNVDHITLLFVLSYK